MKQQRYTSRRTKTQGTWFSQIRHSLTGMSPYYQKDQDQVRGQRDRLPYWPLMVYSHCTGKGLGIGQGARTGSIGSNIDLLCRNVQ